MSRTKVHTPVWVETLRRGQVDHDHRSGECHINPVRTNGSTLTYNHRLRCRKIVDILRIQCDHRNPENITQTIKHDSTNEVTVHHHVQCDFQCSVFIFPYRHHYKTKVVRDETIPCSCDELPYQAEGPCFMTMPGHEMDKHIPSRHGFLSCGCCEVFSDASLTSNTTKTRVSLKKAAATWNSLSEDEREEFEWDEL